MADPLWAKAQLDPSYLAGHASLRDAIIRATVANGDASSLFAQPTGIDPSTGQPFLSIAAQYGIGQGDVAAATTNPYSTLAENKLTDEAAHTQIGTSAVQHGAEFSGSDAAMHAKEVQDAGERNYNAGQSLATTLSGIGTQNTGLITGAYQNLMTQAAADPTIPTPAATPAPAAPAAPAMAPATNGLGSPYVNPSLQQPAAAPTAKARATNLLVSQAKRGFAGSA